MTIVDDKFLTWVNEHLRERGWSYNELARRMNNMSGSGVSFVMRGERNITYDFCIGIANAFDENPEDVLRRAGLLPTLPSKVQEEAEIVHLLRRLSSEARQVILHTMRSLLGLGLPSTYQVANEQETNYSADPPRTLAEQLAWHIARDAEELSDEEQQYIIDLMQRITDAQRGAGATDAAQPELP